MACNYITATWVDFNALTELQKDWLVDEAQQDSISTIRSSLDGLEFILKWEGVCRAELVGLTHTDYSYAEILVEVANSDWLSTVGIED